MTDNSPGPSSSLGPFANVVVRLAQGLVDTSNTGATCSSGLIIRVVRLMKTRLEAIAGMPLDQVPPPSPTMQFTAENRAAVCLWFLGALLEQASASPVVDSEQVSMVANVIIEFLCGDEDTLRTATAIFVFSVGEDAQ